MEFGVVMQTDPPASRVVELAVQAEALGFTHAYTFDSHVLWQEPFVIYSAMLAATEKMVVGPMVTNPGPGTGQSSPHCLPPSTTCTASAQCAASVAAIRPCGS